MTGEPCQTCGLSRSFSEIVNLNFDQAKSHSQYGIPIFLFFLIQLIIRLGISVILLTDIISKKMISIMDAIISLILFFICFKDLIISLFGY